MRPPYLLIVLSALTLALLEPAAGAGSSRARFLVSLRATITKQWSYTSSQRSGGCRIEVTGSGKRTISLRSRDVATVSARWNGGVSRVAFSGAVTALSESVRQSGTKVVRTTGGTECDEGVSRKTCAPMARTLSNRRARLVSTRPHKVGFRRMAGLVPDVFFNDCPGEPARVRAVAAGLALADASLSERDLFDRSVGGMTVEGTADASATLLNRSARIVHHVRWTLTLRRLGS
jgi:hypothetical protein